MKIALKLFSNLLPKDIHALEKKGFEKKGIKEWSATWLYIDSESMKMQWLIDLPSINKRLDPNIVILMDVSELEPLLEAHRGEILSNKLGI